MEEVTLVVPEREGVAVAVAEGEGVLVDVGIDELVLVAVCVVVFVVVGVTVEVGEVAVPVVVAVFSGVMEAEAPNVMDAVGCVVEVIEEEGEGVLEQVVSGVGSM